MDYFARLATYPRALCYCKDMARDGYSFSENRHICHSCGFVTRSCDSRNMCTLAMHIHNNHKCFSIRSMFMHDMCIDYSKMAIETFVCSGLRHVDSAKHASVYAACGYYNPMDGSDDIVCFMCGGRTDISDGAEYSMHSICARHLKDNLECPMALSLVGQKWIPSSRENRSETFTYYNCDVYNVSDMVDDGFVYMGRGTYIKCVFCGLRVSLPRDVSDRDTVLFAGGIHVYHRTKSPDCIVFAT